MKSVIIRTPLNIGILFNFCYINIAQKMPITHYIYYGTLCVLIHENCTEWIHFRIDIKSTIMPLSAAVNDPKIALNGTTVASFDPTLRQVILIAGKHDWIASFPCVYSLPFTTTTSTSRVHVNSVFAIHWWPNHRNKIGLCSNQLQLMKKCIQHNFTKLAIALNIGLDGI